MSPLHARRGFVALLLAPLLAACTGAAPEEPAPSSTAPAATTAAPATTGPEPDPAPNDQQTVSIEDFAFSPAELSVPVGTTVVWTNGDAVQHSIVGDDGLSSPTLGRGTSYEHTFTTPGTYVYACGIHPSMTGTIVVGP